MQSISTNVFVVFNVTSNLWMVFFSPPFAYSVSSFDENIVRWFSKRCTRVREYRLVGHIARKVRVLNGFSCTCNLRIRSFRKYAHSDFFPFLSLMFFSRSFCLFFFSLSRSRSFVYPRQICMLHLYKYKVFIERDTFVCVCVWGLDINPGWREANRAKVLVSCPLRSLAASVKAIEVVRQGYTIFFELVSALGPFDDHPPSYKINKQKITPTKRFILTVSVCVRVDIFFSRTRTNALLLKFLTMLRSSWRVHATLILPLWPRYAQLHFLVYQLL